jgi:hypothetical protein
MAVKRKSGSTVAKDFVAVRVNVTAAQLDQVLSALGVAARAKAGFSSGEIFIMQKKGKASTTSRRRAKK